MNYTYKIFNDSVIELQDQKELLRWSIISLCSDSSDIIEDDFYPAFHVNSYKRSKE
jgi:hypothetical protein